MMSDLVSRIGIQRGEIQRGGEETSGEWISGGGGQSLYFLIYLFLN